MAADQGLAQAQQYFDDSYDNGGGTTEDYTETTENSLPLDENGDEAYTSEWLKENTSISGWLSFFLVVLGIGGVLSALSIFTMKPIDYAYNTFLMFVDVFTMLFMLALAIYTIYAFNTRRPNAIFYARFYVIMVFVTGLLSLLGGVDDSNSFKEGIRGIVWGVVWFVYLGNSKQVQRIIPPSFRKVSVVDWGVLAGVVFVLVLCFMIGINTIGYYID